MSDFESLTRWSCRFGIAGVESLESDEPPSPDAPESVAVIVVDFVSRLSVLKKPLPLKVTPTGWKHLLHRHHAARRRVHVLGEGVVAERLLDLDGLAGLLELVNVRWHNGSKDTAASGRTMKSGRFTANGPRTVAEKVGMVSPMQVRSAVIPAAGLGTRFLPATKAVPKELFPIGDQPALQIVIDEALGAGIDHIVVVSSRDKPAIEAYFEPNDALLGKLDDSGKTALADRLRAIGRDWRATIVYQDNPQGLGHAVGCAREAIGDEPFAVMLPGRDHGFVGTARADERGVRVDGWQRGRRRRSASRSGQFVRCDRPVRRTFGRRRHPGEGSRSRSHRSTRRRAISS